MMAAMRSGWVAFMVVFGACDMREVEVLDAPRVLALRSEPAELAPGEPHTLSALVFDVATPPTWSLCPEAWSAADPPACPSEAITLGQGNPLVVPLPADLDAAWLRVDGAGALPAVKLLEADSGAVNPNARGLLAGGAALPATVAVGDTLALQVDLDGAVDAGEVVVTWYITAGELEPARTLGDEPATLTAVDPGPIEVYAVVRTKAGGTTWAEARLEVAP
jgi:hypothetical protein